MVLRRVTYVSINNLLKEMSLSNAQNIRRIIREKSRNTSAQKENNKF
jgi:hypothetical protein